MIPTDWLLALECSRVAIAELQCEFSSRSTEIYCDRSLGRPFRLRNLPVGRILAISQTSLAGDDREEARRQRCASRSASIERSHEVDPDRTAAHDVPRGHRLHGGAQALRGGAAPHPGGLRALEQGIGTADLDRRDCVARCRCSGRPTESHHTPRSPSSGAETGHALARAHDSTRRRGTWYRARAGDLQSASAT